ncbi:MAG TPA: hypothetical protein VEX16_03780 [Methyloceanibacter sp.]|nr:hypothetical protein [Methyloceanibacter sp.]
MIDVSWPSLVILALTALTIGVTIYIGIRGLHTNLVRSGKLTPKGRKLAIAMCGLGLLTFALGLGDKIISHQKEQAEARERTHQFRQQMEKLEGATESLTQLQAGMQNSLSRQELLYGIAGQTLRVSDNIQREAQANTLNVLQRVFSESNRISPERIAVSVDYSCPLIDHPYPGYPTVEAVQVALSTGYTTEVSLVSRVSTRLSDAYIFHDFLADLGRFETFRAWRSAKIRIRVTGRAPLGTPAELRNEIRAADEELRRQGHQFVPMRCPMVVRLYLNGRQVLRQFGNLTRTSRMFFVLEFEDLRVDRNRLPRFSG